MNNHSPITPNDSTNEVDLADLIRILWRQKMLILAITLIFAIAAILYAHFSKAVYVARVNLQAPAASDLAALNYTVGKDLFAYKAYAYFTRELQSDKVRLDFYNDFYLPSKTGSEKQLDAYNSAAELSSHISAIETAPRRFTVTVQGSTPEDLPTYLEGFLQKTSDSTKQKILSEVTSDSKITAQHLAQEIEAAREVAKSSRLDQITRLQDSLRLAENLEIEKSSTSTTTYATDKLDYFRGSRALKAEIASLQERTNDDPYIKELRGLVFQKEFFSSINIKPADFEVFAQDGPIESLGPIKPKSIIISIGIIFGGLMGVIIALCRYFVRKHTTPR